MKLDRVAILYPSGNTTALVFDPIDKSAYREVNDFMLATDPSIEVVMFVNTDGDMPVGEMAGGEFCGNATRSFGFYLLNGKPGETFVRVSGAEKPLKVRVQQDGVSKAEVPVPLSDKIISINNDGTALVDLDGISHLVLTPSSEEAKRLLSTDDISWRKQFAEKLLISRNLMDMPTCGVIGVAENQGAMFIYPYIHSNTLDDWYAETACGSGSLSVALVQAKSAQSSIYGLSLRQPSGHDLIVGVRYKDGELSNASIEGRVNLLFEGEFTASHRPVQVRGNLTSVHKFSR